MNLTIWPEIASFITTDRENKIPDSKSVRCIVSSVMNLVIWHDPVQENGFGYVTLLPLPPFSQ